MRVERHVVFIVQTEDGLITAHETRESAQKEMDRRAGPGRILERTVRK